jgi:hypothetical protein
MYKVKGCGMNFKVKQLDLRLSMVLVLETVAINVVKVNT